jgi:hypothetical protein
LVLLIVCAIAADAPAIENEPVLVIVRCGRTLIAMDSLQDRAAVIATALQVTHGDDAIAVAEIQVAHAENLDMRRLWTIVSALLTDDVPSRRG